MFENKVLRINVPNKTYKLKKPRYFKNEKNLCYTAKFTAIFSWW